jgi:AraC-like DNA-binding protein
MLTETGKEVAKYWSAEFLGGLECLYAEYLTFSFAPHFHEGFAIGVVERGADVFDYRGARQVAAAGNIIIFNPAEVHNGHAADETGWTFRMMYIDPEHLRKVREEITGRSSDIPFFSKSVVSDAETARLLVRLHRALETSVSGLERESLFLLAMTQLVARHADSGITKNKTGNEHAAVARLLEYLHANACQDVKLDELAKVAFLSPFHLLRIFREETGITPHAYQIQLRIEKAKRLLRDRSTIAEAAHSAGFFDQAHFSKQFKRHVGITPGQFR